ncbi:hypothetical protein F3Y22_tig00021103pilonHSYRG00014 [Hibiscus syriacus]|uniref:Uncharacterized protein n=1 Tax=Hibiscus syriacus TaxID=106335 RepID=A0A6A3BTW3_HIBSY|nr:hypothetical protein F3Y22_tig00021103pilonHSYRG00014 [Hibiscus syriacus]
MNLTALDLSVVESSSGLSAIIYFPLLLRIFRRRCRPERSGIKYLQRLKNLIGSINSNLTVGENSGGNTGVGQPRGYVDGVPSVVTLRGNSPSPLSPACVLTGESIVGGRKNGDAVVTVLQLSGSWLETRVDFMSPMKTVS